MANIRNIQETNIVEIKVPFGWTVCLSVERPNSFDEDNSVLEDTTEITTDEQEIEVNIYDLDLIPVGEQGGKELESK